jgi:membrane protein implicated in regulation of membrane protease activity
MGVLYTVAAFAGLGWAVVSFLLGHLGGDAGGHDADAGGAHAGGHDHDADHEGLPLLSPTVLAGAAAGFGFTGLGLRATGAPALLHLPLAAGAGAGLAFLLALFLAKAVRGMEATTSVTAADVEGLEAEVIVPIPAGGLGEIAFVAGGSRMIAPARDHAGAAHPRGARVLVTRVRPDGVHDVEDLEPASAGGTTRITEG